MSQPTSFALASPGLLALANRVLHAADPSEKVRLTREAVAAWRRGVRLGDAETAPVRPARPQAPEIMPSARIPRARDLGVPTNVYLLHALAHVELNAIDLSVDTLVRYADAPGRAVAFAGDMLSIAEDEARHFEMLHKRLLALGSSYGALPAHDIVWNAAERSRDCCLRRLALGQLVQEARGLDAGPRLASRLTGAGDVESAALVRTIADEELRHVRIGVKWFVKECANVGCDPVQRFHDIALLHANPGAFAPPFDQKRRSEAGLEPEWYLPVAEQMSLQMKKLRMKRDSKLNGAHSEMADVKPS